MSDTIDTTSALHDNNIKVDPHKKTASGSWNVLVDSPTSATATTRETSSIVPTDSEPNSIPTSPTNEDREEASNLHRERKKSQLDANWIDVQAKTFTRWINYHLSKRGLHIDDIKTGLSNGHYLNNLLEIISKKNMPRKWNTKPKMQVHSLDNLVTSFEFMENEHVKLVNIRSNDIESGNLKIILGLAWNLIQKYSYQPSNKTVKPTHSRQGSVDTVMNQGKLELLNWVNARIASYDMNVSDFAASWTNGRVLTALIDSLDTNSPHTSEHLETLLVGHALDDTNNAMQLATTKHNIPVMIDATDMCYRPQEQSTMTYIMVIRELLESQGSDEERAMIASAEEARIQREVAVKQNSSAVTLQSAYRARLARKQATKLRADKQIAAENEAKAAAEQLKALQEENEKLIAAQKQAEEELAAATIKLEAEREAAEESLRLLRVQQQMEAQQLAELQVEKDRIAAEATVAAEAAKQLELDNATKAADKLKRENEAAITIQSNVRGHQARVHTTHLRDQRKQEIEHETELKSKADNSIASVLTDTNNTNTEEDYSTGVEEAGVDTSLPAEVKEEQYMKKLQQLMKDVEVSLMTSDNKRYVQSTEDSSVRVSPINSMLSSFVVVDGVNNMKFFRNYKYEYITTDATGRVYMSRKSPSGRFKVVRETLTYFVDMYGNYLTYDDTGRVFTSATKVAFSGFRVAFPIIEGNLKKKGTSGLKRWQQRFFIFNGNSLSYWRDEKAAGKERPDCTYLPKHILSVNINKTQSTRFNIIVEGKPTIEIEANSLDDAIRWVRALNLRGIKTVQQSVRLSVMDTVSLAATATHQRTNTPSNASQANATNA